MRRWPYERVVMTGTWTMRFAWYAPWKEAVPPRFRTERVPWLLSQQVESPVLRQQHQWRDITHA